VVGEAVVVVAEAAPVELEETAEPPQAETSKTRLMTSEGFRCITKPLERSLLWIVPCLAQDG
jgi:hypothetical protein